MKTTPKGLQAQSWKELDSLAFTQAHKLNSGRAKALRPEDIQDVVQDSHERILVLSSDGKVKSQGHRQALSRTIVRGELVDMTKSPKWHSTSNFSDFTVSEQTDNDVQNFEIEKVEYRTPADVVADRDYYVNRMERAVKLVNPAEREVLDSMLKYSADKGKVCAELRLTPAQLSRKLFKIREQVNS